jgi:Domain of unknown function (DUF4177)
MYEYKFVHHAVSYAKGQMRPSYETVVHAHAAEGWRLVQIFIAQPASMTSAVELIFERERASGPQHSNSGQPNE